MLPGHLGAGRPKGTSHEGDQCPRSGAAPERAAVVASVPREDGRARDMQYQRLQQQLAGLREEFLSRESWWVAAHNELQRQVDALREQSLQLQDRLQASGPRPGARERMAATLPSGQTADSLVLESRIAPPSADGEERPKCIVCKPQSAALLGPSGWVRTAAPPKVVHDTSGGLQRPSGRHSPVPAPDLVLPGRPEPAAATDDTRSSASASPAAASLASAESQMAGRVDTQTMCTACPRGSAAVRLHHKQTEKLHPDGSKEIVFADGTVKRLKSGHEETLFPDGTVVRVRRNGDKIIVFSNGQREIHTAQFERREYPDGTARTVYFSGLQETRCATGSVRVRVRDEAGTVILDRKPAVPPQHSAGRLENTKANQNSTNFILKLESQNIGEE
ncbi:T-complex protein 10A homolog [Tupaia chinensis]|uniref:T-complex protein 10A homolog n=1 Tax=Tupaia chinensis TaxID=246437 RepID=UPI0003C8F42C|nr:T-complex protein 10A homolog [Tupaia chinensis]